MSNYSHMHILQLCKKFPYPLKDGESIAVTYLSRAFKALNCEVSLLAMNTSKHYTDLDSLPDSFSHYTDMQCSYLDNEVTTIGAFKNLFSQKSFHLTRFYSHEYEKKLTSMLKENSYDIIQIESLYLAQYIDVIRKYSDALVVMRAHNVEHEIWDRISENTRFLPKRIYLKYLTRKLQDAEKTYLAKYDYLVAISGRDLKKFREMGYTNGATVAPIGVKIEEYKPIKLNLYDEKVMPCFIGSLDWMPNIEGLQWFLDEIWPDITREFDDVLLHIAGRNADENINYVRDNTVFHGEVESATEWLSQYNVMVVPLLSGSGMRAKIIEAMALGMIVITTSIGLEGIPAEHRHQVLVADNKTEFIEAFNYIYKNKSRRAIIGKNARKFAQENYNNIFIASELLKTYREYLNLKPDKNGKAHVKVNYSLST